MYVAAALLIGYAGYQFVSASTRPRRRGSKPSRECRVRRLVPATLFGLLGLLATSLPAAAPTSSSS